MILNSKQLEELENIQDASGEFEEESSDPDGYVEGVENALAWRRGMIERAVLNIRKILRKPAESLEAAGNGSLIYLKDSKRFARVQEGSDGNTELSFVGPGSVVQLAAAKPEKGPKAAKAPKAEKPAKVAKPEKETKIKAEKLPKPAKVEAPKVVERVPAKAKDAKPQAVQAKAQKTEEKKEKAAVKAKVSGKSKPKVSVSKKSSAKTSAERVTKKVPLKTKKAAKVAPKVKPKKPATKKAAVKNKPKAVAKKPLPKKLPRKSASSVESGRASSKYMMDPVADPNSYIRSNFRLMSNKELSHVTGLSEHTIRRKLGEWGLKRI